MKTETLCGAYLDYYVAKAENKPNPHIIRHQRGEELICVVEASWHGSPKVHSRAYSPHSDWAIAGPLIEKYGIGLLSPKMSPCGEWHASVIHPDFTDWSDKDSVLVAICRCIVASKFGEEVPDVDISE